MITERIREIKREVCPNCDGLCWQCRYSYYDFETREDVCLFEEIIERYNNREDKEN